MFSGFPFGRLSLIALMLVGAAACTGEVTADAGTTAGVAASALTTDEAAATGGAVASHQGDDGDWFNPANWSIGRVPGPGDDVELDGTDVVVIDAARDPRAGKAEVRDFHVRHAARFEARGGAIVQTRHQYVEDRGEIVFRASGDLGEDLVVAPGSTARLIQNPNPKSKRFIVLESSVTMDMGLGGVTPAALTIDATGEPVLHAGPGHHSTLTADSVALAGNLTISLYYGFIPLPGDTFTIITARRSRTGEFAGLPEGALAGCTEENVCLRITYHGGAGNDVVLTAETVEPRIGLLLPAIQRVREAAAATTEDTAMLLPAVQKVREAANR